MHGENKTKYVKVATWLLCWS